MEELLKSLQILDENGSEEAGNLYWEAIDLPAEQFPLWVAQNDRQIRKVLNMDAILTEPDEEERKFAKAYQDLRNEGLSLFKGDKKLDPYGKPVKTLDDFMGAFGVPGSDGGEYSDDDRAAFTNEKNAKYWKNMPKDDQELAALSMGYSSAEDMARDLERAGNSFQVANRVEGWDENNEVDVFEWIKSTLKGAALPRVKEAQLAGREPTWQDYTGDMAELGLNFVPGVGLVAKGGKVVARLPGMRSGIARTVGAGIGLGVDQAVVPFGTQAIDANILYDPDVLGTSDSELNPRSEFDLKKAAAQTGAIAGAKGTVKGTAMVGKNMLEQGMGNEGGGRAFRGAVKMFESIGEKTDDLIARRQLALDRKADLAKVRKNVTLPVDKDISTGVATTDDLINAENYRNLTKEAERLMKSRKAREKYGDIVASQEASYDMLMNELPFTYDKPYMSPERVKLANIDPNTGYSKNANSFDTYIKYKEANEKGAEGLFQLPDGRIVRRTLVGSRNDLNFPGAEYSVYFDPNQAKNLTFQYDGGPMNDILNVREVGVPGVKESVSRNPAVLSKIKEDQLLKRKLSPWRTGLVENTRDTFADATFNALAREGVVGNVTEFDKKREQALWNRMLTKLRPLTANANLSPETRRENGEAVMNVMQYGLDRLPVELYQKNPRIYKTIADNLGVKDWKHFSENDPTATTSYSTAY